MLGKRFLTYDTHSYPQLLDELHFLRGHRRNKELALLTPDSDLHVTFPLIPIHYPANMRILTLIR